MLEGKEVTWFPSYGAEVRGGTANCTVVISDEMIGSPVVSAPEILIVMSDASLEKFIPKLKEGGVLMLDSSLVQRKASRHDIHIVDVPATEIASRLGRTKSANMVLFGALVAETGFLGQDSAFNAIETVMPAAKRGMTEGNKNALLEGMHFIENKKS
jgi:2-oxoglutarate ferredoxin oxidoreductase subunit gamma